LWLGILHGHRRPDAERVLPLLALPDNERFVSDGNVPADTNEPLTLGSAFIWTIHFPAAAFAWTHSDPPNIVLDTYVTEGKPWKTRYRCKNCGCCVASYNDKTMAWSVWGTQLERENEVTKNLDGVEPSAHIFYGTRLVDVNDELGKWEGYENKSIRIS